MKNCSKLKSTRTQFRDSKLSKISAKISDRALATLITSVLQREKGEPDRVESIVLKRSPLSKVITNDPKLQVLSPLKALLQVDLVIDCRLQSQLRTSDKYQDLKLLVQLSQS